MTDSVAVSVIQYISMALSRIWDSSVSVVTGYELDNQSLIPGGGWEFFSLTPCPDWLWDHPASSPMDARGSFPGGKMAGA
jgi:hypothetical protein